MDPNFKMTSRVRNKAAAPIQISAEHILREAVDRTEEKAKAPTTRFADLEELTEYQGRERAEFEKYVRISPHNTAYVMPPNITNL